METIHNLFLKFILAESRKLNIESFDDEKLDAVIDKCTYKTLKVATEALLGRLRKMAPDMLEDRERLRIEFENYITDRWGRALNLFRMFFEITIEAGQEFNEKYRPEAARNDDILFDILVRLHARACQIGFEIYTLMRSGFADGAHARWRSLHETVVVACFLKKHGLETARAYLAHEVIESFKATNDYQKYHQRLGYDPVDDAEFAELKKHRDSIIEKYGSDFGSNYGWAAKVLKVKSPRFSDLEENVEFDHMRPYYRMASHNVHANPKSIKFKLGQHPANTDHLLAGASVFGLADPGVNTTISIYQITTTLLTFNANMDWLVVLNILKELLGEVEEAFNDAAQEIEETRTL